MNQKEHPQPNPAASRETTERACRAEIYNLEVQLAYWLQFQEFEAPDDKNIQVIIDGLREDIEALKPLG